MSGPNGSSCPWGIENRQRIIAVERDVGRLTGGVAEVVKDMTGLKVIDAVTATQLKWMVAAAGAAGSIVGGILTAVLIRVVGG